MFNRSFIFCALCIATVALIAGLSTEQVFAQSWQPQGGPTRALNVRDITIDQSGAFLYAADEVRLVKSVDGGMTWEPTGAEITAPLNVLVKPDDSEVVLVARTGELRMSEDGGQTWVDLEPPSSSNFHPLRLTASPVLTDRMILGKKYSEEVTPVWYSRNAGREWSPAEDFVWQTDIYDIVAYPAEADIRTTWAWAAGVSSTGMAGRDEGEGLETEATTNGVWFSPNLGEYWDPVGLGTENVTALAVYHDEEHVLYAGSTNGRMFKGRNMGSQWQPLESFPGEPTDTVRAIRVRQDNGYIFVATDREVYRSIDEGESWERVINGIAGTKFLSLVINPENPDVMVAGSSAFIYRTEDGGEKWVMITDNTSYIKASSMVTLFGQIWIASSELPVVSRYDGISWRYTIIEDEFSAKHLALHPNYTTLFASGKLPNNQAALYRSDDEGDSFTNILTTLPSGTEMGLQGTVFDPISQNRIYAFGIMRTSYEGNGVKNYVFSTDFGESWIIPTDAIGGSPVRRALAFAVAPEGQQMNGISQMLYAGLEEGGLWRVIMPGGWQQVCESVIPSDATIYTIATPSYNVVYAAGTVGGVGRFWTSTDRGETWKTLSSIPFAVKRIVMNPRNPSSIRDFFVVTNDGSVYRTRNGGITFENLIVGFSPPIINTLPTPVFDIGTIIENGNTLAAVTPQGIYRILPPSVTTTNVQFQVSSGWNIRSIGSIIPDFSWAGTYPGYTGAIYIVNPPNAGYQVAPPFLSYGQGHYVKFSSARTITHEGDRIKSMWVPVGGGQNMIGTISDTVFVSSINHYWPPTVQRLGPFMKYINGGYVPTDTLIPGTGYWVQFNQNGLMYLEGISEPPPGPIPELASFDNFTITDSEGNTQELYVRNSTMPSELGEVEMPPANSEAEFYASFVSGHFLRAVDPNAGVVDLDIFVDALAYPLTISWNINPDNGITYSLGGSGLGKTATSVIGSGNVMLESHGDGIINLTGVAQNIQSTLDIPKSFMLYQNYPNPFNPFTIINYQLPNDNYITLKVYDVLGREVATLVDDYRSAGNYDVSWDASNMPSGVYIYKLTAGSFTDVKKMLLMK